MVKQNYYIIEQSNGRQIPVDPDEVKKVFESLNTGQVGVLRQGVFNPSFFVNMVKDEKRMKEIKKGYSITDEGHIKPIKKERSEDIFNDYRSKSLNHGNKNQQ